jgi:putative membrane protein
MKSIVSLAPIGALSLPAAAWAQGPGPWRMHEWTGWGWGWGGGMWLGPLFMIALLVLLIAAIVALVRWMGGGSGDSGGRVRTARDILDERYARGEIDREEYQRRRDDIAGRS